MIATVCGIGVGTVHEYLRRAREPRMRQAHKAGEKLFVDYAGQTIGITDRVTGEVRQSAVFVATLGASNYAFAEATASQSLPDWIGHGHSKFGVLTGESWRGVQMRV